MSDVRRGTGSGTEHDRSPLEAALAYARVGWPVFPCIPGEKVPVFRGAHPDGDPSRATCQGECGRVGHGFHDATTDADQIREWWGRTPGRNVAIATGTPGPDVLDVDQHGERGSGFAAFNRLKREGLVPDPLAVVSTPSGGFHAYFGGTAQRSGKLPRLHLDYRAQGGYVVAPPSTVGGARYEVVRHDLSRATFDWDSARSYLEPDPERQPVRERLAEGPRDVTHLAGWVARQQEGNRNDALFWASCRAVEAGRSDGLEDLARAAAAAGLDEREAGRTIRSALRTARPLEHQREAEAG